MGTELTELKQSFIDGLKLFPISKTNMAIVYLMLHTDAMKIEMMKYLLKHQDATEAQILSEAERISKQSN